MNRVLLSIGDPNGIGPEIAVKAARRLAGEPALAPVLVGSPQVIEPWAKAFGAKVRELCGPAEPRNGLVDVLPVPEPAGAARPGEVTGAAGAATVAYLRAAVAAVRAGLGRGIVAGPHSETAVNAAGIRFDGYSGLLADLAGVPRDRVFLMLAGGGLRIVHATLHQRLADALRRLSADLVVAAGLAAAEYLRERGVAAPRLGLFGINPHAGEGGLFGDDDARITEPAAERLRGEGLRVVGPLGADVPLASPVVRGELDAWVAMYHDQGHIPVKVLAGRTASALTVGAGLTFSSVGHGAAFDIAGRGVADPEAVVRAIRLVGSALPAEVPA